jgi:hypothetical protein
MRSALQEGSKLYRPYEPYLASGCGYTELVCGTAKQPVLDDAVPKSGSGKSAVSPLVSHGLLANWRFRTTNFSENLSRRLECCLSG